MLGSAPFPWSNSVTPVTNPGSRPDGTLEVRPVVFSAEKLVRRSCQETT